MTLGALFPGSLWDCPYVAMIAIVLDLWLGDPPLPWRHPVCAIGGFLNYLEPRLRQWAMLDPKREPLRLKAGGFFALASVGSVFAAFTLLLCHLPYIGILLAIYFAWAGLAMGCLLRTGSIVLQAVEHGSLEDARSKVSWLVSRQTSAMDRTLLRKTLADTLGENYTDAFLAPFFWLLLTGVPGLWFYKVASTMDSQWGYLTPEWKYLGYAGARTDDLLAFIPARLAPLALGLAHFFRGLSGTRPWQGYWPGYGVVAAHARVMPSPNSGWPMAACAFLCSGRMAGPAVYFGRLQDKPFMGPPGAEPWNERKLLALHRLLLWGSVSGGGALLVSAFGIHWFL